MGLKRDPIGVLLSTVRVQLRLMSEWPSLEGLPEEMVSCRHQVLSGKVVTIYARVDMFLYTLM